MFPTRSDFSCCVCVCVCRLSYNSNEYIGDLKLKKKQTKTHHIHHTYIDSTRITIQCEFLFVSQFVFFFFYFCCVFTCKSDNVLAIASFALFLHFLHECVLGFSYFIQFNVVSVLVWMMVLVGKMLIFYFVVVASIQFISSYTPIYRIQYNMYDVFCFFVWVWMKWMCMFIVYFCRRKMLFV